jgi:transposase
MGLFLRFQEDNFKAVHVADFLRALLRHLRGHVILLWDGGSIHKGAPINAVLAAHPRLHVERFPAYAPELNSVEFVWRDFKGRMANGCPFDLHDLDVTLRGNERRVRGSQAKLRSFVLASKLSSPFH